MKHGQQTVRLLKQFDQTDRVVTGEVFLAKLMLARRERGLAAEILAQAEKLAHRNNFIKQIPHIASVQVLVLLCQGNHAAADRLAQMYELPISQARVKLAIGDTSAALAVLEPLLVLVESKGWTDEQLKVKVIQALALHAHGEQSKAVRLLADALKMAEPYGFIRTFVDEGMPMMRLLREAVAHNVMPYYIVRLQAAFFEAEEFKGSTSSHAAPPVMPLIEPLSDRELEVLRLIAKGLSNREICDRLFLALSTVKGHNRVIFDKLQVVRRTEAVAKARNLGLL